MRQREMERRERRPYRKPIGIPRAGSKPMHGRYNARMGASFVAVGRKRHPPAGCLGGWQNASRLRPDKFRGAPALPSKKKKRST